MRLEARRGGDGVSEYEDCEVCFKTCCTKTQPLHDVQAGRICSECHYLNEYGMEVTA